MENSDQAELDLYMGRIENHIEHLRGLSEKINKSAEALDNDTSVTVRIKTKCHSRYKTK